MTYLTRALLDHPERSSRSIIEENCPEDFLYEKETYCVPIASGCDPSFKDCGNCWSREMPAK